MNKLILLLLVIIATMQAKVLVAQTPGELSVSAFTLEAGGNYAPRNVLAIWIEDSDGNFIKTLMAYAQNRRTHLNIWQASTVAAGSEFNTTDAITGATRSNHANRSATWNGTDFEGNLAPDGDYQLWFELTDKNGTGNYGYVEFVKSSVNQDIIPVDLPSFYDIIIQWQPDNSVGFNANELEDNSFAYDQVNALLSCSIPDYFEISIFDLVGNLQIKSQQEKTSLAHLNSGVYIVVVTTDGKASAHKIVVR